jgi:integrase
MLDAAIVRAAVCCDGAFKAACDRNQPDKVWSRARPQRGGQRGEPDRRYVKADAHALAISCAPSSGYKWSVPVNPAGLAKHYFEPALAALGFDHVRWHDLRHAFAVMSLTAGEHYMAVSKMLGHASYVTTLTVYADYITEGDGGKAAPLRRPVPSSVTKVVPMRRPG